MIGGRRPFGVGPALRCYLMEQMAHLRGSELRGSSQQQQIHSQNRKLFPDHLRGSSQQQQLIGYWFLAMKMVKENAGQLTNFEVLEFLRSRGAAKDPTRVLAPVAPSEYKVYDYLENTAASSQTRESIAEFLTKCKPYKLTKPEIAAIINIRPTSYVEIDPLIEDLDTRLGENVEELVELIVQVFPPSPDESKADE